MTTPKLEAHRLIELGYRVFPCKPNAKTPATPHGCKDATTDADQIEAWWNANPAYNIAVSTDGLVVIDPDTLPDGSPNPWLTPERALELGIGAATATPRGGRHYWFRQPDGVNVRNSTSIVAEKVDVRANGGYVVVPPSVLPNGGYQYLPGMELDSPPDKLPLPPAWLMDDIRGGKQPANGAAKPKGKNAKLHRPEGVADGDGRRDALYSEACALWGARSNVGGDIAEPAAFDAVLASLNAVNAKKCKPPVDAAEVRRICERAREYIRSHPAPSLTLATHRTELANSERFTRQYRAEVLFVPAQDKFRIYDGTRWAEDAGEVGVMLRGKDIARELLAEAVKSMDGRALDFAMKSAKHAGVRAMINLAASDLAVDHNQLDADPMLLNVANGTIDLKTGQLRPHDPGDLITKICPVRYDPDAECPRFRQFLAEVFPSVPMREFVQRLIGYTITGDVSEQVLPIFWGIGSNGKTTLLTTLQDVLGDYAGQAPPALLTLKKNEQHPTEIAGLFGQRLVVASETEGGCRLAEALVKQLTGCDVISARRMREDFWTFRPTHKLILLTNHKPKVRGTDHGIWRRLLLVPFNQVFEGARKDKKLPDKLRTEAAGILRWGVDGCREWQAQGLRPPEEVRAATRQYRSGEDVIGRFVADCCVTGGKVFVCRFADLYSRLESWCKDGGDSLPSAKTVGNWLQDNGFERFHSGAVQYRGIGLKA